MNELQSFENIEFGSVRTVLIEGKTYFVAGDVAKALGYAIPHKAVQAHCKGVLKWNILTNGGSQEMLIIPEGDIYRLVIKSQLPAAERFEHWIFDEVLPSIRRYKGYITGQEILTDDELLEKAVLVAKRKIAERDKVIEQQREKLEESKPKIIFADAVSASNSTILIGELAKLLRQNGIATGEKRLFAWMRQQGYLISRRGTDYNMPTQRSMEMMLFEVRERVVNNPDGSTRVTKTTVVTGKGQQYFINKFLQVQEGK